MRIKNGDKRGERREKKKGRDKKDPSSGSAPSSDEDSLKSNQIGHVISNDKLILYATKICSGAQASFDGGERNI